MPDLLWIPKSPLADFEVLYEGRKVTEITI